jgi:hypothetical protein
MLLFYPKSNKNLMIVKGRERRSKKCTLIPSICRRSLPVVVRSKIADLLPKLALNNFTEQTITTYA